MYSCTTLAVSFVTITTARSLEASSSSATGIGEGKNAGTSSTTVSRRYSFLLKHPSNAGRKLRDVLERGVRKHDP